MPSMIDGLPLRRHVFTSVHRAAIIGAIPEGGEQLRPAFRASLPLKGGLQKRQWDLSGVVA